MHLIDFFAAVVTFIGYWTIVHDFAQLDTKTDKVSFWFKLVALTGFSLFITSVLHKNAGISIEHEVNHWAVTTILSVLPASFVGWIYLLKYRTKKLEQLEEEVKKIQPKEDSQLDFKKTLSPPKTSKIEPK